MSATIRVAAVAIAAGAAVLALFWLAQRRMMYFPSHDVPPPAQVGLAGAENITFRTADGLTLHGWFVPSSERGAATVIVGSPRTNGGRRSSCCSREAAARTATLRSHHRGVGRRGTRST